MNGNEILMLLGKIVSGSLSGSKSSDFKATEDLLIKYESLPGFYPCLTEIMINKGVDENIRLLACVHTKNAIDRYWRKSSSSTLSKEEKKYIRDKLVLCFDEPSNQVANQLAVIISRIARLDIPQEWPELMTILIQKIQDPNAIERQRAMLYLLHTIKALCSKSLPISKKFLHQMSPELFGYTYHRWNLHTESLNHLLVQNLNAPLNEAIFQQIMSDMYMSLYSLKCLRQIVNYGLQNLQFSDDAKRFLSTCQSRLVYFLEVVSKIPNGHVYTKLSPFLQKKIILIQKLFLDLQENHSLNFMIDNARFEILTFHYMQLLTSHSTGVIKFERFMINCLQIVRGYIKPKGFDVISLQSKEKEKEKEKVQYATEFLNSLWTEERIIEITKCLVLKYLPLRSEDIENWKDDPEEFVLVEEEENTFYHIRPCSENVFQSLITKFQNIVSKTVIQMLKEVSEHPVQNYESLLIKDAVYGVVALGSQKLYDDLDFDSFFTSKLIQESQIKAEGFQILRRRIAILIEYWVSVKMSQENRNISYQLLISLLSPQEDLVVRLTACKCLITFIDDFDFDDNVFTPYLEKYIELLAHLLHSVSNHGSQVVILKALTAIVSRMESKIQPFAQSFLNLIPRMWSGSENDNLLQISAIDLVTKVVEALREGSQAFQPFGTLLVEKSIQDPLLIEDGLILWRSLLHNADVLTPELSRVFPLLHTLSELASEALKTAIDILNSYIMLDGATVFKTFPHVITGHFAKLQDPETHDRAIALLTKTFDCLLRVFPACIGHFGDTFKFMMSIIIRNETGHHLLVARYLCIFSRLILVDSNAFYSLLGSVDNESALKFIHVWIEGVETQAQLTDRKLSAFALSFLLRTNSPLILQYFPQIFGSCFEVVKQLSVPDEDDGDMLYYSYDEDQPSQETMEGQRRMKLMKDDPIHSRNIKEFIKESLIICQQLNGPVAFQQASSKLSPSLLQEFTSLLSS